MGAETAVLPKIQRDHIPGHGSGDHRAQTLQSSWDWDISAPQNPAGSHPWAQRGHRGLGCLCSPKSSGINPWSLGAHGAQTFPGDVDFAAQPRPILSLCRSQPAPNTGRFWVEPELPPLPPPPAISSRRVQGQEALESSKFGFSQITACPGKAAYDGRDLACPSHPGEARAACSGGLPLAFPRFQPFPSPSLSQAPYTQTRTPNAPGTAGSLRGVAPRPSCSTTPPRKV